MLRKLLLLWLLGMLASCGDGRAPATGVAESSAIDKDAFVIGDPAQCLSPTAPVYRFTRAAGGPLMVADEATKAAMLAGGSGATLDGEIFRQIVCGHAAIPLYRFTNRQTQAEFYTADRIERDRTRTGRPELRYDGVAFHVAIGRLPGTVPVYRLSRIGQYFYTVSVQERDRLDFIEGWNNEGTAFHAYPPQVGQPTCPAGQYWNVALNACTSLCPLASDVFVPGAGCQKKRVCTGGTLIAASNTCQCPAGTVDDPVNDRCAPTACENGQIFVPGRGCEWKQPCFNGTLSANNVCTCAENEILNELEHWCEFNVGFNSKTSEEFVGGADGGPGADGGGDAGVGLGAVRNAMVEFWGIDASRGGRLVFLGRALSDPVNGLVHFKRGSYDGPAWVRFLGRAGATYFDESLFAEVPFPEGAELNALVDKLDRGVGVTVLTEAAFQYARTFYRSPGSTEPQKVEFILSNGFHTVANEFVRTTFNSSIPGSAAVTTSITQLPYPVTASTPSGALPNNKSGRYAMQMNSTVYGARAFNDKLRQSGSLGGSLAGPGIEFARQYAADLADGRLDSRADGKSIGPKESRTYTTRSDELTSFGMPSNLLLADTLTTGLYTAASTYASPSLSQSVLPPNSCTGPNAVRTYVNGYGPLCCPVAWVTPGTQWPSGCPLNGRGDYRRVFYKYSYPELTAPQNWIRNRTMALLEELSQGSPAPANVGCTQSVPIFYLYPTFWLAVDVHESRLSSMPWFSESTPPLVESAPGYEFLFNGTTTFPPCPSAILY